MNYQKYDNWFAAIILSGIAVLFLMLGAWAAGCGSEGGDFPSTDLPVVSISCDEPVGKNRCFVIVHNADTVDAFYSGVPAWWDHGITEDRVSYLDSPPGVYFSVEACNENGCTTEAYDLRLVESECAPPAPECEYGRTPLCHCYKGECKWYCASDKRVFKLAGTP